MFDFFSGTVTTIKEKSITLLVGQIGFNVFVPKADQFALETTTELHTYFHWNAENGPSIYGFQTELERKVFLLIIDCPKIGPSIALNILSQMSASNFLEVITTNNEKALTNLNGIGTKKAEQIIMELKHKVQKLLNAGELKVDASAQGQQNFVQWQQLTEVLTTLNYSKQEATKAVQYLSDKYSGQNYPLDQLIRSALAYLSQKQA